MKISQIVKIIGIILQFIGILYLSILACSYLMCRPLTENVFITSVAVAFNGVGWGLRQIADIIKESE
jgi:hypothetical protein